MTKKEYAVSGMTCASCAKSVESILSYTPGVKQAAVNYGNHSVTIEHDDDVTFQQLQEALEEVGYGLVVDQKKEEEKERRSLRNRFVVGLIFSIPVFILGMFFMSYEWVKWVTGLLSIPVIVYSGAPFFIHGFRKATKGIFTMDTLVAVGTGSAFLYSVPAALTAAGLLHQELFDHVYFEAAAVVITLILLGRVLESRAKQSANSAISKLLELQPRTALKIEKDGTVTSCAIEDLISGDHIAIQFGNRIPVDGTLLNGALTVDESMLSGESLPVEKEEGDKVFAGTLCQSGNGTVQVEYVQETRSRRQLVIASRS
jgi:Cu2+-exporting ATPase